MTNIRSRNELNIPGEETARVQVGKVTERRQFACKPIYVYTAIDKLIKCCSLCIITLSSLSDPFCPDTELQQTRHEISSTQVSGRTRPNKRVFGESLAVASVVVWDKPFAAARRIRYPSFPPRQITRMKVYLLSSWAEEG